MFSSRLSVSLALVVSLGLLASVTHAAGPDVLPDGKFPADARLAPPKNLDGYFPFTPSKSTEEWTPRAQRLKRQILVSQGLVPLPTKTPLNAVIHGKLDRGDYTVERVMFESMPGFYVTGNLYRPVGKSGKLPVVLCPHGHFSDGRFHDAGVAATKNEIASGAERFEEGGRSPLQAHSVTLARMGCVVFHYDMIGYADSTQLTYDLVHRFAKQRPEMNGPDNWGFFSPAAESHLQSVMGLQTWNSIRAIDFVETLPDVDKTRIGVTGSSGGGTQTFLLAAVDPRIVVSVPVVMVSTAMQGGCTCENSSLLRVGTGNVEFAALFAPKPQLCISADDWTKEMPTKGFPDLAKHYQLVGASDNVGHTAHLQFGHNYNYVNRGEMYKWMNKHLKLGLAEPIVEGDYKRLTRDEMTVWTSDQKRPPSGPDFEKQLCKFWHDDAEKQLAALLAKDPKAYAQQLREAWQVVVDADPAGKNENLPAASAVEYDQNVKEDRGDYIEMAGILRNKSAGVELPVAFAYPKEWKGTVVIWLSSQGKSAIFNQDGKPTEAVAKLLKSGASVMGIDMLYQGEFLTGGKPLEKTPVTGVSREFAGYTFGYNRTVLANRVHDVLTALAYVRAHEREPKAVALVALDETAPVAAIARAIVPEAVTRLAIDTRGFRFAKVADYRDPQFLPGAAKYHDLPGALALAGSAEAFIASEKPATLPQLLALAGQNRAGLHFYNGDAAGVTAAATNFVLNGNK